MSLSLARAAFHHAAETVPAYRDLLFRAGIAAESIRQPEDFPRVPQTDKASLFARYPLAALCVGGSLDGAHAIYTSSGHSGIFSFGVETPDMELALRDSLDQLFAAYFGADRRRIFLVNALPMGVRVPTSQALVLDIGPRADAIMAALQAVGASVAHRVIVGEQPFLKHLLESGAAAGWQWAQYPVSLVTGAEVMPENFRIYADSLLGHEPAHPARGATLVSLGVSEVSLSLGQETSATIQLRKAVHAVPSRRTAIFGYSHFAPTLVQYDPARFYLETPADADGRTRLVVTTLDRKRSIPLIRYATGDWARVFSLEEMLSLATRTGLTVPPLGVPWPFLAVFGRGIGVAVAGQWVYPEQVKEALYASATVANSLTGDFRLSAEDGTLRVRVQLKPGVAASSALLDRLHGALADWVNVPAQLTLEPFASFPQPAEPSFHRKFQYLEHP